MISPRSTDASVPEISGQHHTHAVLSRSDGANPPQVSRKPPTSPTRSDLLRAALGYAEAGIPVFPCKPGRKEPLTRHGHKDATRSPQQITALWNRWPEANIGVPCGERSGILAVDVDHPAGLEAFEDEHGELPATRTHGTGSGGMHYLYRYPAGENIRNSASKLAPGLDVRGEGGYVVVPPSRTTRPYEVLEDLPLADAPGWLLEALTRKPEPRSAPAETSQEERPGRPLAKLDVGNLASPGPIPVGRRNVTLTSLLGRAHDGSLDLAGLAALGHRLNEEHCVVPLPTAEVEKIARSIHHREPCKPQGKKRAPEEVQTALVAFERKIGAMTWGGHASNRLSLLKTYVLLARKHGELREDGVAVSVSNSQAALHNGVSARSVRRNNAALAQMGLIRSDNEGRAPTESGTLVLLSAAPYTTAAPGCVLTHIHQGAHTGEEEKRQAEARGGGLGQNGAAAWSATRARHGKPLYDSGERVGFLSRMGKRAELAVDVLEEAGGKLRPGELAGAMGITKVRNMFRDGGWLWKLMDAGVVERDDEGYLCLTREPGWLGAWDRRRVEDEEEMDRERDRERYRRMSEAWAQMVAEHAENRHQKRLRRIELECFDRFPEISGEIPPEADGLIEDLERVEEASEAPPVCEAREPSEALSGLAVALGEWLEKHPRDHPGRHPPADRTMQLSWLGATLVAYDMVQNRPTVSEVAAALASLELARDEEAAA